MLPNYLAKISHQKIEHPYAEEYNLATSFEFGLPLPNSAMSKLAQSFGNTIAEVCSLSPALVYEALQKNLSIINNLELQANIKLLLDRYAVHKVVVWEKQFRVKLTCLESEDSYSEMLLLPLSAIRPSDKLSGVENYFSGMRESYVNEGGFFPCFDELEQLFVPPQILDSSKWENCVVRFVASNGELIIENPEGDLGWYLIGQGQVAETEFDYLAFTLAFVEHVTEKGWQYSNLEKKTRAAFDSFSVEQNKQE